MKIPIVLSIVIMIELVSFVKTDLCSQRQPLPVEHDDFTNISVGLPRNFKLYLINDVSTIPPEILNTERPDDNVCHIYDFPPNRCNGLKMKCRLFHDSYHCNTYAISVEYEDMIGYEETIQKVPYDGHLLNDKHVYQARISKMYWIGLDNATPEIIAIEPYVLDHYNKQFAMTAKGNGWRLFEFCDSLAAFVLIDADMPKEEIAFGTMYSTMIVRGIMDSRGGGWTKFEQEFAFDFKFKP